MLDDAKAEIMERAKRAGGKDAKPEPTTRSKQKRDMTKEEREAYIQKKRAEEEARLLKKASSSKPEKKDRPEIREKPERRTRRRLNESDAAKEQKAGELEAPRRRERKNKGDSRPIRPLEPLVPLHLLKIPGLPEGDFLAICYVKGGGK